MGQSLDICRPPNHITLVRQPQDVRHARNAHLRLLRTALLVFLLVCVASHSSYGQFYFGKNKVQYTRFNWQVMTTEHFRVYFYEDEPEVAKIAAGLAEDSYEVLSARFNHEVRNKIPLIIYSTSRWAVSPSS
jgi:hypothetical protein